MDKKIIFIFVLCFVSMSAFAQYDSTSYKTDEIVVYGNKVQHSLLYSPVDVKIFLKQDIDNLNGGKLYDVINYCGGVHLKSYAGINSLKTISFNGLGAEQSAVLLNGIKLNSQQNSQVDLSMIPLEDVERVEVLNSGYGSLYGSDASGGVINIRTQDLNFSNGKKYLFNWRFNSAAGSYGYYNLGFNTIFSNKIASISFGYNKEKSNNNYDFYYNNGINLIKQKRENASFSGNKFTLNSNLELWQDFSINYYGYYYLLDRNLPSALNSFFTMTEKQKDRSFVNIIKAEYKKIDNFSFKTQFGYQENIINYEAIGLFRDYYSNRNYVIQLEGTKLFNKYSIYSGAEINYNTFESETIKNIKRTLTGIFITGEFNVIDNLKIFPSLRYESASDVEYKKLYSKLGINLRPIRTEDFHIRVSISNNGRVPAFNDLYWIPGGNPDLKPENALNIDAGFIYGFKLIGNNLIDFNYTNIFMKDKITWLYNPQLGIWTPVNIGKTLSNIFSIDFKSIYNLGTNISLVINANYTYNNAKKVNEDYIGDLSKDKQLPYVPIDLFKLDLNFMYKDLGINLFYNLIGKRYSDAQNTESLNPAGVLDGNVYYNLKFDYFRLRLTFEINNITNTDYSIMPGYPMPLRNYLLKLSLFN
ncbi:MAG: TonB-dependent receptor [Ignavibacteria bacterium]|nr:TonB-dependent receptor [Ignavibacteria bacterium]